MYAKHTQGQVLRTQAVRCTLLRLGLFLWWSHFEVFFVSSDSLIFRESSGGLTLDGNLSISFLLFHFEPGSSGTAWFRRPARAAFLPGLRNLRFVLFYFFGALRQVPWGTQGLFCDTLNKRFSFREEVRSWSRSC